MRPGVSYSLRGSLNGDDGLFVMIDVVDDDPEARWLSVCFYDAQVTDPKDIGDWVPEGLNGKDARCFDIGEEDAVLVSYVAERIQEAAKNARSLIDSSCRDRPYGPGLHKRQFLLFPKEQEEFLFFVPKQEFFGEKSPETSCTIGRGYDGGALDQSGFRSHEVIASGSEEIHNDHGLIAKNPDPVFQVRRNPDHVSGPDGIGSSTKNELGVA